MWFAMFLDRLKNAFGPASLPPSLAEEQERRARQARLMPTLARDRDPCPDDDRTGELLQGIGRVLTEQDQARMREEVLKHRF